MRQLSVPTFWAVLVVFCIAITSQESTGTTIDGVRLNLIELLLLLHAIALVGLGILILGRSQMSRVSIAAFVGGLGVYLVAVILSALTRANFYSQSFDQMAWFTRMAFGVAIAITGYALYTARYAANRPYTPFGPITTWIIASAFLLPSLPLGMFDWQGDCRGSQKQVAIGLMIYAFDYDEHLPAQGWMDATSNYSKVSSVRCGRLRNPTEYGIALNKDVYHLAQGDPEPKAILIFDSSNTTKSAVDGLNTFIERHPSNQGLVGISIRKDLSLAMGKKADLVDTPR